MYISVALVRRALALGVFSSLTSAFSLTVSDFLLSDPRQPCLLSALIWKRVVDSVLFIYV